MAAGAPAPRYMFDTNAASAIIRGTSAALRERLRQVPIGRLCISAVTHGELRDGLARKPEATALHAAVQSFLIRVDTLPWDAAAADRYGELRATLERQGTPLGQLDTLIAAHAWSQGCVLVTNDRALLRVAQVQVEDWMGV
ncbi:MAG: type II toxin-antitoxin system VapC family toxin [Leptothrix sp. (in: b-proteobacteria)]